MKPKNKSKSETAFCPSCKKPALLRDRIARYRRGRKVASVKTQCWECPSNCIGPDGSRPFQFHDARLLRQNDEAARVAWRHQFGEDMPRPSRPGRKSKEPRVTRLQVLLTEKELKKLDESR